MTKQIKELNNVAVKLKTAEEKKIIIALFEAAGFKRWDSHFAFNEDDRYITLDSEDSNILGIRQLYGEKLITLDQLIWDYGINPEWAEYLIVHDGETEYYWHNKAKNFESTIDNPKLEFNTDKEYKIISTRPQEKEQTVKLQNGDYLPVSEIKTEQDYQGVVKAAENCGHSVGDWKEKPPTVQNGYFWISKSWGLVIDTIISSEDKTKLTLAEWLERGGVTPQETQEYMPEVGEECLVKMGKYWNPTNIVAHYDGRIVFDCRGIENTEQVYDAYLISQSNFFKPLPTKEEEKREEFIELCRRLSSKAMHLDKVDTFGLIYDHLKENNLLVDKN